MQLIIKWPPLNVSIFITHVRNLRNGFDTNDPLKHGEKKHLICQSSQFIVAYDNRCLCVYNCRRAKIFYLSQPGFEPRSLDLQANTLPRRCKAGFYRKAVEVCYIPSPVTFSPTKLNFVPEVSGHRESFLMRLGELLPGSRVGYLRWAPLS